jgi:hypothetical protein
VYSIGEQSRVHEQYVPLRSRRSPSVINDLNHASLDGGKLGRCSVVGNEVRPGPPFLFNKTNIDRFNF